MVTLAFSLSVHSSGHVDLFDDGINAANTVTTGNLDAGEATITPAGTPRVLNLPVVGKALGVSGETTATLGVALVPPLVDGALRGKRLRRGIRGSCIVSVANYDDSVVEGCAAAISLLDHTALVVHKGAIGIQSHRNGLLLQSRLHFIDAVQLWEIANFADGLVTVMHTGGLSAGASRSVRVVSIEHDTLFLPELPSPVHPATIAAIAVVVFAKE